MRVYLCNSHVIGKQPQHFNKSEQWILHKDCWFTSAQLMNVTYYSKNCIKGYIINTLHYNKYITFLYSQQLTFFH